MTWSWREMWYFVGGAGAGVFATVVANTAVSPRNPSVGAAVMFVALVVVFNAAVAIHRAPEGGGA